MKKSELKEMIKANFLAEAEDSKKGNKEEQKRMEGAIRDDRDHIKSLEKDIKDNEAKLSKLKKDEPKDISEEMKKDDVEEGMRSTYEEDDIDEAMRGGDDDVEEGMRGKYEEDDIQAEAADAGLLKKIGIDGDVMEMVKKMRAAIESGKVKDADLGGIEGIGDAVKQMVVDSAESFLKEAEEVDVEDNEDINVDVEDNIDIDDVSDKSEIEVDSELAGEDADVSAILGLLTKAQANAKDLGDEKLMDQIGNTITYYTRAHVVATNEEVKEEVINEEVNRFRKLAGLIK